MAENEISEYFETDADNVDIAGVTVQENVMKPSNVNNAFRGLQGALKRWFKTSLFRLRDSTDQTKLLALDLGQITTATTRTHAFPNYNGRLSSNAKAANLASAATVDIGLASGDLIHITGTTGITSFGSSLPAAGAEFDLVFDGILVLTHNATSLIIPGAADVTTAPNDTARVRYEGSGNWRVVSYTTFAEKTGITTISNANGRAIRYPDGTQICMHTWTLSVVTGGTFVLLAWTYPAAFTGNVYGWSSLGAPVSNQLMTTAISALTGGASVYLNSAAAVSNQTGFMYTVGRWF